MSMFDSSLTAMIKGLRANKNNEDVYISSCLREIKNELESTNLDVKSGAICKLWYLQMFGHAMDKYSFHVLVVMTSPKFVHKRPSYSACLTSFDELNEACLLTINQMRKDFNSKEMYDTALALNCLSNMCTTEMCQDLCSDVLTLTHSTKPYIRKKSVLSLYKLVDKNHNILMDCINKLKDRLTDEDPGVCTATATCLLELGRKNPKLLLTIVPRLYQLFISSRNNWLIIKLLKVFTLLCPFEERLTKKLTSNIHELLLHNQAKSVEYECVRFVLCTYNPTDELTLLAIDRLKNFLQSSDANLKYLGVSLQNEITEDTEMLKALQKAFGNLEEKVLEQLEDSDPSLQDIGLSLLNKIVTKNKFEEVVERLLNYARSHAYGVKYLRTLLDMGTKNNYALIKDFKWYLVVLTDSAYTRHNDCVDQICKQLIEITVSRKEVRGHSMQLCCLLLEPADSKDGKSNKGNELMKSFIEDESKAKTDRMYSEKPGSSLCNQTGTNVDEKISLTAAKLLGEFIDSLENCGPYTQLDAYKAIYNQIIISTGEAQATYIWSCVKLYFHLQRNNQFQESHDTVANELKETLAGLANESANVDVAERAFLAYWLVHSSTFLQHDDTSQLLEDADLMAVTDESAQLNIPFMEQSNFHGPDEAVT